MFHQLIKQNKMGLIYIALALLPILGGCNSNSSDNVLGNRNLSENQPSQKCYNPNVEYMAKNILIRGMYPNMVSEVQKSTAQKLLTFKYARPTAFHKSIKEYSCAADLHFEYNGTKIVSPITYMTQIVNSDLLVENLYIPDSDILQIKSALSVALRNNYLVTSHIITGPFGKLEIVNSGTKEFATEDKYLTMNGIRVPELGKYVYLDIDKYVLFDGGVAFVLGTSNGGNCYGCSQNVGAVLYDTGELFLKNSANIGSQSPVISGGTVSFGVVAEKGLRVHWTFGNGKWDKIVTAAKFSAGARTKACFSTYELYAQFCGSGVNNMDQADQSTILYNDNEYGWSSDIFGSICKSSKSVGYSQFKEQYCSIAHP